MSYLHDVHVGIHGVSMGCVCVFVRHGAQAAQTHSRTMDLLGLVDSKR